MKDYQVSKVYRWESNLPTGGRVKFEQAQSFVNYIWADMGYMYPPKVMLLDNPNGRIEGKANRTGLWLKPEVTMQTLLHELAHSFTAELDGYIDFHGPDFVGIYVKLMHKYMNVDLFEMIKTLAVAKIDINYTAKPYFAD